MDRLNSLITIKQTTKFSSANFQKMLSPSHIILRIQRLEANSVELDEVAHYEPPHQDLRCLQIQLFSSLVVRVNNSISTLKTLLDIVSPAGTCIIEPYAQSLYLHPLHSTILFQMEIPLWEYF